jgi:hypothetical protein
MFWGFFYLQKKIDYPESNTYQVFDENHLLKI